MTDFSLQDLHVLLVGGLPDSYQLQWPQKKACGCIALHVATFREMKALIFNGSHRCHRQMWSCRYMARLNTAPVRHNTVAQRKGVPVCQQALFLNFIDVTFAGFKPWFALEEIMSTFAGCFCC